MPAAAGIRFAEMRPVLYGSLSASFDLPSSFTREEMARNNAAVASGSAAGNPEAYRLRKCDRCFTGAFLLLLIFRPRSLVKKWPGTMQLLLQDPPQAIRKLTDVCYRAF
ncbi:hypothetical protein [Bacillus subtilis]|uniref:Uncharacterized protein n=1 Tax=Bacillus subtilis subsp. natto TaxID=86029 RepID=E9RJ62_BACNA|nr:hypothetical protein [Bacillus subtilis]AMK74834.1 hypothetical protein AWV81_22315 [Bacillus subtilis subsp. natto]BAJ76977.1 hypothetical protein [Bacillus subtilis subsp. natto]